MLNLKILWLLPIYLISNLMYAQSLFNYPPTKKIDQIDDYHGYKIADPYRWLENIDSKDTQAWAKKAPVP